MKGKNLLYKVVENRDDMQEGIANCEKVIAQQKKLCDIVENSSEENKEEFKDFIKQLKEGITRSEEQLKDLKEREAKLTELINKAAKDEDLEQLIYSFISALGIDQLM